jgi:hypothetical protein
MLSVVHYSGKGWSLGSNYHRRCLDFLLNPNMKSSGEECLFFFSYLALVVEKVWTTRMSTSTVQFQWAILTGLLSLLAVTGQIPFNCSHPE